MEQLNSSADHNAPVWFYVDGVLPRGPFTYTEILKKFEAGEIHAGTVVYRNGESNWLPLAKEPAFAQYFSAYPELKRVRWWQRGWIWMALVFLLLAAYPLLSTVVVQKDALEEDIKVGFVDLCQENGLELSRAQVTAVELTKEGEDTYVGMVVVKTASGEKRGIPVSVKVEGSMLKGRTISFTIEDGAAWLRENF